MGSSPTASRWALAVSVRGDAGHTAAKSAGGMTGASTTAYTALPSSMADAVAGIAPTVPCQSRRTARSPPCNDGCSRRASSTPWVMAPGGIPRAVSSACTRSSRREPGAISAATTTPSMSTSRGSDGTGLPRTVTRSNATSWICRWTPRAAEEGTAALPGTNALAIRSAPVGPGSRFTSTAAAETLGRSTSRGPVDRSDRRSRARSMRALRSRTCSTVAPSGSVTAALTPVTRSTPREPICSIRMRPGRAVASAAFTRNTIARRMAGAFLWRITPAAAASAKTSALPTIRPR